MRWARAVTVVAVLVAVVVVPASASSANEAVKLQTSTFRGVFPDVRPASRTLSLKAGEALTLYAHPTGKYAKITDGDTGISIAGTVRGATLAKIEAGAQGSGDFYSGSNSYYSSSDSYYSGGSAFFSYYGSSAPAVYGTVLFFTTYYDPQASSSPVTGFQAFGRGWGHATASGSWIMFVAPVAGSYTFLIAGKGAYAGAYAVRQLPDDVNKKIKRSASEGFDAGVATGMPYSRAQWARVVEAQIPFLFDSSFYPSSSFYSDYGNRKAYYGPSAKYRKQFLNVVRRAAS